MKVRTLGILAIVVAASAGFVGSGRRDLVLAEASHSSHVHAASSYAATAIESPFVLPTASDTQLLLEAAAHNSEFVSISAGRDAVRAFVSYPERGDAAPAIVVTGSAGMNDWMLAVAFQAARDGFVAVAPDYLTGHGPGGGDVDSFAGEREAAQALTRLSERQLLVKEDAVHRAASAFPAVNGTVATVSINEDRIVASTGGGRSSVFSRDSAGWSRALVFLSQQTGNRFDGNSLHDHVSMELRMQARAAAQEPERGQRQGRGRAQSLPPAPTIYDWKGPLSDNPGMTAKRDDLPASSMTADRVVATTPRRNEWIDIPVPNSNDKVHTWVVYPAGNQPAGTIVVMHGGSGMTDWVRAIGDQLAKEGFLALVTDMASGLGPNGGNFDSFAFIADKMRATGRLTRDQTFARIKAVRDYGAKMPRSNGKTGSIGFCAGGSLSFQLATRVPEHNASVVYYGAAPPEEELAKTTAPVIGFYGENDPRLVATVEPTRQVMARLGKSYEAYTYPNVTHSFVQIQDLANNFQGTAASWPKAIEFFKRHLSTATSNTR
jgi:carboxymethylenebutenolidase